MIASLKRNIDIVKPLLDSGANVNATRDNGWSALISAVVVDDYECVKTARCSRS